MKIKLSDIKIGDRFRKDMGDLVLDPFMGSGAFGEAALELDRKFIGIEIDKEHYSNASQRLANLAKCTKSKINACDNILDKKFASDSSFTYAAGGDVK